MTRSPAYARVRMVALALAVATLLVPISAMAVRAADPDTIPPSQPGDLHLVSRTKSGSITLGWTASTDNVGVTAYTMRRNGTWAGTLYQAGVDLIGTVWYDKIGGRNKPPVRYELFAVDAAGNMSEPATLVITQ